MIYCNNRSTRIHILNPEYYDVSYSLAHTRRYIPVEFHDLPGVSGFGSTGRLKEVYISRKLYDGDIVNSVMICAGVPETVKRVAKATRAGTRWEG
jgi:hypothetical protein